MKKHTFYSISSLLLILLAFGYSCSDIGTNSTKDPQTETPTSGEDEDNSEPPPTAGFSTASTTIYAGDSVDYVDQSSGNPTTWEWTFEGGTPSSSSLQNPQDIIYEEEGKYNVELTVSNEGGTDTISNSEYIIVESRPCLPVTDIDGNTYPVTKIGEQCWTTENLRTARYDNGDEITNVRSEFEWQSIGYGAWSYFENDSENNQPFGKLYNWYVAGDRRNVCPTNWHVPSREEWRTLVEFLGGTDVAGLKMKSTTSWVLNGNENNGTNESGFDALLSGMRDQEGKFYLNGVVQWWSSTNVTDVYNNTSSSQLVSIWYNTSYPRNFSKGYGFPIRCVMN